MKFLDAAHIPNVTHDEPILYHCVWFCNHYGVLDHHILSLASLFATQKNPQVKVWTDHASFSEMSKLVTIFEGFPLEVVCGEGILPECRWYQMVYFRADKWRFEILKRHGGIYFDLDVLFLRDLSWCAAANMPFVQHGYTDRDIFNNALMYFPPNHPDVLRWLSFADENTTLNWETVFRIQKISDAYECYYIDNWLTELGWDLVPAISTNKFWEVNGWTEELEKILPAFADSYVYHWHNRWHLAVTENSIVGKFFERLVKNNPRIKYAKS